jgi:uncharacterized integral membrane protein
MRWDMYAKFIIIIIIIMLLINEENQKQFKYLSAWKYPKIVYLYHSVNAV